jgi:enoyl-CoA hydratase/carnithine racemase
VLTGARLTGDACLENRIVKKSLPGDILLSETLKAARAFNKRRAVVQELKRRMYRDIVRILDEEDPPVIDSGVFYV